MGTAGQGRMTDAPAEEARRRALLAFRDRFALPLSDDAGRASCASTGRRPTAPRCGTCTRGARSSAATCPRAIDACPPVLAPPDATAFARFALEANGKEMSTTMAFVRMLSPLLKDRELGTRIVPIVADEARTFGMADLFRQVGIYSPVGQLYEPEDSDAAQLLQGSEGRPDPRRRHHRSRRDRRRGSPPRPATGARRRRCCRSTSSTRCSASSASAI